MDIPTLLHKYAQKFQRLLSEVVNVFREPYWIVPLYVNSDLYKNKVPLDIESFRQTKEIQDLNKSEEEAKLTEEDVKNKKIKVNESFSKLTGQNSVHPELFITPSLKFSVNAYYLDSVAKGLVKPVKSEIKIHKDGRLEIGHPKSPSLITYYITS